MLKPGKYYTRQQVEEAGLIPFKTRDKKIAVYINGTAVIFFNLDQDSRDKMKLLFVCDN